MKHNTDTVFESYTKSKSSKGGATLSKKQRRGLKQARSIRKSKARYQESLYA